MDSVGASSVHVPKILREPVSETLRLLYSLVQAILDWIFSPRPPPPSARKFRVSDKRIAVIGAGLTGVSSAAHCVGNGFEATIFEGRSKEHGLGGVWSRVYPTASLQVHGMLYRFHPAVRYDTSYPGQQEIRREIIRIWDRYDLDTRTFFNTPVTSVAKNAGGRWIINDDQDQYGEFDGVIAAVGVSGDPKMARISGQEKFKGEICHSSEMTPNQAKDKRVVIIGGGASAVEVLQLAVEGGAARVDVLSRSDKWVIPRNIVVQTLIASNVWGEEVPISWIPEWLLRKFFYRDLQDITPTEGLYTASPLVNSSLFRLIRQGDATWDRGDVLSIEEHDVRFNARARHVPKGGPGKEKRIPADIIVMATGYKRPSLTFLPADCFEEAYSPPNWYLQVFPPKHPTICATNSTYISAIATAGHLHVGILTRFLLAYIVDPLARPTEGRMKAWVDFTQLTKIFSPRGPLNFLTYAELLYWCVFVVLACPFRWKWSLFILTGQGGYIPEMILKKEDEIRGELKERHSARQKYDEKHK